MSFEQSNQAFIIAAYAITWGVMLGYMVYLSRKSARASRDFDSVALRDGVNR